MIEEVLNALPKLAKIRELIYKKLIKKEVNRIIL
jgi:hypothetical protein